MIIDDYRCSDCSHNVRNNDYFCDEPWADLHADCGFAWAELSAVAPRSIRDRGIVGSRTVRARHPHTQHHHLNTLSRYRNIAHTFTHAFNFPKSTLIQISYLIDLQRDNLLEISATKTSSGPSFLHGPTYANSTLSISKN